MTTENMSKVHEKNLPDAELKKRLKKLIVCQKDIDKINERTSNEMLRLEEKFEKLRGPLYKKRDTAIKRLPNFWGNSFHNHPNLAELMGKEGLRFIRNLKVENLENINSGYRIHLHFDENPYFENKVLTKEFRFGNSKEGNWIASTSTPIKWKEGMQNTSVPDESTEKTYKNFFDWFLDNDNPDFDHVGDLIRDDIWINPLRYYCLEAQPEDNSNEEKKELDDERKEDDDDGDEEGNEEENDDGINEANDDNRNEEDDDN